MSSLIQIRDTCLVEYLEHMGSDVAIVSAARLSYNKGGSKGEEADRKLLRYLFTNKHTSPFEMGKIVFRLQMPIFVARQYTRHRMQNMNEMSGRYTELEPDFFLPMVWRGPHPTNKQSSVEFEPGIGHDLDNLALHAYRECWITYKRLLEKGVATELARIVLPVGIYTKIVSCWDLNNLLKFFRLRDDNHAQKEIQDMASQMKAITAQHFPWTMELYNESLKK